MGRGGGKPVHPPMVGVGVGGSRDAGAGATGDGTVVGSRDAGAGATGVVGLVVVVVVGVG